MTPKNFVLALFFVLILLLTTACQSSLPGIRITSGQDAPRSAFIPSWEVVQTGAGQALLLQTFFVSPDRLNKLKALTIKVNGQPLKFHRSGGLLLAPYPPAQGQAPVSLEAACASNHLGVLQISPETIQLADTPTLETLPARFSNSAWPVSLTWQGCVPGTYELSLTAADTADQAGLPVTQRIEVK